MNPSEVTLLLDTAAAAARATCPASKVVWSSCALPLVPLLPSKAPRAKAESKNTSTSEAVKQCGKSVSETKNRNRQLANCRILSVSFTAPLSLTPSLYPPLFTFFSSPLLCL